jgi:hypothetical protein
MSHSKITRYALHSAGIARCSIIAFLIWLVSAGIGLSPIINRPDDLPRTEESLPGLVRFCGFIADSMSYPFAWISPGSILDGPQSFILEALFWGTILYLCVRGAVWMTRRNGSPSG